MVRLYRLAFLMIGMGMALFFHFMVRGGEWKPLEICHLLLLVPLYSNSIFLKILRIILSMILMELTRTMHQFHGLLKAKMHLGRVLLNSIQPVEFLNTFLMQTSSGVHSFYIKLESSEQSSSFPITLNIQNIEDAPVFKEADNILPDASVNVSYEYNLLWEDADNEIPSFSIVSEDVRTLPDGLNLSDGRIIGVPEQEGEHIITVRMEDDESLFVDKNFTLRVISSNAKPIVLWNEIETSRILIRLTEDFSSNDWTNSLDELEVSDPDVGDIISYSINQFPQHGTLVVNNLVDKPISYVSNPNYSGTDRFTVLLSDGRDTTELEFIVTVDPVNDAPILIANEVNGNVLPRPLELNVSESFRHVFAVSDPDIGDRVKLSFSDLPQWLNFDGNFTLEGTPWTKDFQEDPTPGIYVYISDLDGASSTQYFELQLKPKDYPPEIDQEGPVSFTMLEDTEVSFVYQLSSTDQDSEVTDMNWSVTDHPSHGTIHLIGGESNFSTTVTYMPFADFTGKDTFEVTVYNKSFADAVTQFLLL